MTARRVGVTLCSWALLCCALPHHMASAAVQGLSFAGGGSPVGRRWVASGTRQPQDGECAAEIAPFVTRGDLFAARAAARKHAGEFESAARAAAQRLCASAWVEQVDLLLLRPGALAQVKKL